MSYPDSVQFLYTLGNEIKTAKLGLERIRTVLSALGDPQKSFRSVHVAGTNGKGSTCAMIEAALRSTGVRTGLFTSPHLVEPTERIQIEGIPVTQGQFQRAFEVVHETAGKLDLDCHPTYFETVTAMAFWLFRGLGVETAVIETGLGGRLDATNVIEPILTVITPIDFDHEAYLGHTIEAIAGEKAGILKAGVPAVFARQRQEAKAVLEARARELGIRVARAEDFEIRDLEIYARGSRFNGLTCPLAGEHQVDNAVTAVLALRELGVAPEGIADASWPGRLEFVSPNPDVILDGAHNPAGARALARYLTRFYAGQKIWMIFGAMRDKAIEEVAEILFPMAGELILTAPDSTRAIRPEALVELAGRGRCAENLEAALEIVRAEADSDDVVVITGSLFLIGEARRAYSRCRGQLWDSVVS
ncbi:MAG TPA: folylpolyglutamate synthase/dihydrofolate synthase family protein [Bryobacteraceae bacterium]